MAAHLKCLKYIEEMLYVMGPDLGYRVCQLGNCGLRSGLSKNYLWRRIRKLRHFLDIGHGFEVTAIDINGRNKALPIDLSVPIEDESLLGSFDLIVGYALIEHIEDQYGLFKNIHNLCRVGGLIILNGPAVGYYAGHGTWTYDFDFFINLLSACGYPMLDIRMTPLKYGQMPKKQAVIYTSYIKKEDSIFIEREEFRPPYYDLVGHGFDSAAYSERCKKIKGDI